MKFARIAAFAALFVVAAPAAAQAQTADAGANPPLILLAPRMPDGGVYGYGAGGSADAGVAADAGAAVAAPAAPEQPPAQPQPAAAGDGAQQAPVVPPPPPQVDAQVTAGAQQGAVLAPVVAPSPVDAARLRRAALFRARLALLNNRLPPLVERSRSQRVTDGAISLATGAGMGALTFLITPTSSGDLRPYLWTLSGISLAQGLLSFIWVPARESLSAQFDAMPMATPRQQRARVRFGERAVDEIAADGARRRVLGALGGAAVALVLPAVVYADPIFNGRPYAFTAFDAILIGFSAIQAVTSLVQLFGRSGDERLRDDYLQQVRILRESQSIDAAAAVASEPPDLDPQ